ncbi:1-acyl-sn-glycerol-3-phosphate acyltransferase [Paradesertivirga mongoliensis]|uniref:1-acyl-sn-glycerol-3-phosphate acyltransferase n=1 Tax=Paradesertivirga mongoliensis TaxID=2100740 RepID=A0ABW4ZGY1_9SPHI|nr:1-acyl-sn-glycerol-3-phosphate acyltransferase [Pedobacter mongoliensis]
MIKKLIVTFFNWYIDRIIARHFNSFSFNKLTLDQSRSVLLLANHFSWWDGFLMFQANRLFFKKNFHVMVTEENYNKVAFLKYLGAFPVKRNSRNVFHSLEYAGELLDHPENLVLIFPQGKLYSNHVNEVVFEKGLMQLISFSKRNFQYLFAASFVDYFEKRKPSVTCYLNTWEGAEFTSLQLIKDAYNKHYETSRQEHNQVTI